MFTFAKSYMFCVSICLLFLSFSDAISIAKFESSCLAKCNTTTGLPSNGHLKYVEGHTYTYEVDGSTLLRVPTSVKGGISKIKYTAKAEISVISECSYALVLSNVNILTADGKKHSNAKMLEGDVTAFVWNDGLIKPEICVTNSESPIATNIKRSILSNLQISSWKPSSSVEEVDVFGHCTAHIEVKESGPSKYVRKHKNLSKCKHERENKHKDSHFASGFINANSKSVITVERGLIKTVEVLEEYNYFLLNAHSETENTATVEIRMALVSKNRKVPPSMSSLRPVTITYVIPPLTSGSSNVVILMDAIHSAASASTSYAPNVFPSATTEFKKLVKTLQEASKDDILAAYARVKSNTGGMGISKTAIRQSFFDGIVMASTDQSLAASLTLIESEEFPNENFDSFLRGLSFVRNPSLETLNEVKTLLNKWPQKKEVYLGFGSLVGTYIRNDKSKVDSEEVEEWLRKISSPLSGKCLPHNIEQEDTIIASLKGLQNMHYIPEEVANIVAACLKDKRITQRMRVNMLQTLRIGKLSPDVKEIVWNILQNQLEDSEIRIHAFLTYIKDPDYKTAENIKNLLDTELSNQVGNYITSYIKNLRNSARTEKKTFRDYLHDVTPNRDFVSDIKKYSQNFDVSYIMAALNLGCSMEADIIYSQKSYIPRSYSLGLSVNILGSHVNFLQADIRLENVESILEKYFGPRSFLQNSKAEDVGDVFDDMLTDTLDTLSGRHSYKRSRVSSTAAVPTTSAHVIDQEKEFVHDVLNLDLDLKISGHEVSWYAVHKEKNKLLETDFGKIFLEKLQAMKHFVKDMNIDYKKYYYTSLLSNIPLTQPTSSGFPLVLEIDANAVVNIELKGGIDIESIMMKDLEDTKIELNFSPRAVAELDSTLSVDTFVAKTGLKVSASLNTATEIMMYFKGLKEGFEFKYDIPHDKQDILTLKTEAFSVAEERGSPLVEVPLNPVGQRLSYNMRSELLSNIFGVTVEAVIDMPKFSFRPLVGSSKLSLRLVKTDESLKGYYVKSLYSRDRETRNSKYEFVAEKLGTVSRIYFLIDQGDAENKIVSVEFQSPWKNVTLRASVIDETDEYSIGSELIINKLRYGMKLGAVISGEKYNKTYKPFIKVLNPSDPEREVALSGIRLSAKTPLYMPIHIDGHMVVTKDELHPKNVNLSFVKLRLSTPITEFKFDGVAHIIKSKGREEAFTDVVFSYGEGKNITLYGNYTLQTGPIYLELSTDQNLRIITTFSEFPQYNFNYTIINSIRGMVSTEEERILIFGPDLNSEVYRVRMYRSNIVQLDPFPKPPLGFRSTYRLTCPFLKFDFGYDTRQDLSASAFLEYGNTKGKCNVDYEIGSNNIEVVVTVDRDERTMHATGKLTSLGKGGKYIVSAHVMPFSGENITLESNVTYLWTSLIFNFELYPLITYVKSQEAQRYELKIRYDSSTLEFVLGNYTNDIERFYWKLFYSKLSTRSQGEVVFNIRNKIQSHIYISVTKDEYTGQMKIGLVKHNQTIEGNGTLQHTNTGSHDGYFVLSWDSDGHDVAAIKVETHLTQLDNGLRTYHTDNTVKLFEHEYTLRGNLFSAANGTSGKGELFFPGGHKIDVVYLEEREKGDPKISVKYTVEGNYYHHGDSRYRVKYVLYNRNIMSTAATFDIENTLTYGVAENRYLTLVLNIGKGADNGKKSLLKASLEGPLAPVRAKVEVTSVCDSLLIKVYESKPEESKCVHYVNVTIGQQFSFVANGETSQRESNFSVTLKYPDSGAVKSISLKNSNNFDTTTPQYKVKSTNIVTWNSVQYMNININADVAPRHGKLHADWESSLLSSKKEFDAMYEYEPAVEEKTGKLESSLQLKEGEQKTGFGFKVTYDTFSKTLVISGESSLNGPFDISAQIVKNMTHISSGIKANYNDENKLVLQGSFNIVPGEQYVNIEYETPSGRYFLLGRITGSVDEKMDSVLTIGWPPYKQALYTQGELKLTALDVLVNFDFESEAIGIQPIHVKASTVKNSKQPTLVFELKKIEELLCSGRLEYMLLNNEKLLSLQGTGYYETADKKYPFTLSLSKMALNDEEDTERGTVVKCFYNIDNGYRTFDAQAKFTDKAVVYESKCCHRDTCHPLLLAYQMNMEGVLEYERNVTILVGRRLYSLLSTDGDQFSFSSVTKRRFWKYDHSTIIRLSPTEEIKFISYMNEEKLGTSLSLPTEKAITAEANYRREFSIDKGILEILGHIALINQNVSTQSLKAEYFATYNIDEETSAISFVSNAKAEAPTLPQEFGISTYLNIKPEETKSIEFKTVFNVFRNPSQAVVATYEVFQSTKDDKINITEIARLYSEGQRLDYRLQRHKLMTWSKFVHNVNFTYVDHNGKERLSSANFAMLLSSIVFDFNILNHIRSEGGMSIEYVESGVRFVKFLNVLNHKYSNIFLVGTDVGILVMANMEGPVNQQILFPLFLGSNGYIGVGGDLNNSNGLQTFFNCRVWVTEDKFLTPEMGLDRDVLKFLMDNGAADMQSLISDVKNAAFEIRKEVKLEFQQRKEAFSDALIDVEAVTDGIAAYVEKVKEDLMKDKAFQEISVYLSYSSSGAVKVLTMLAKDLSILLKRACDMLTEVCYVISDFVKRVTPIVANWAQIIVTDVEKLLNNLAAECYECVQQLLDLMSFYSDPVMDGIKSIAMAVRDVIGNVPKLVSEIETQVVQFTEDVVQFVYSLPELKYIEQQLTAMKNSKVVRYVIDIVSHFANWVKQAMPTPELRSFLESVYMFINKVSKKEPVNIVTELRNLFIRCMQGVKSISDLIRRRYSFKDYMKLNYTMPSISFSSVKTSISHFRAVWFSSMDIINMIISPDIDDAIDAVKTLDALVWTPPESRIAMLVQGKHVITFNKNHYGFRGNNRYILATDILDKNFTITVDIHDGKVISLAVTSGKYTVEAFTDGKIMLNSEETNYPVYVDHIYAMRDVDTIEIRVDNSIHITCTPNFSVILAHVSGFYHGRVTGIFGNTNGELFMDYSTPSGEVLQSVADFVKSHKVGDNPSTELEELKSSHEMSGFCTYMFSEDTVMKKLFGTLIETKPYIEVCNHMTSDQCYAYLAYSLTAYSKYGFYLDMPDECSKCYIGSQYVFLNSDIALKLPQKKADILFLLETTEDQKFIYTDFLTNVKTAVTKSLSERGITDVNYAVMGYGSTDLEPTLYTNNGSSLSSHDVNITFPAATKSYHTVIGTVIYSLKEAFGLTSGIKALGKASFYYPFRPDAVKAVIHARSSIHSHSYLIRSLLKLVEQTLRLLATATFLTKFNLGDVPVFLLDPRKNIHTNTSKLVFGYDSEYAYTSEGKESVTSLSAVASDAAEEFESLLIHLKKVDGAVFNSAVYKSADQNERKELVQVFADRVTKSLIGSEVIMECTCDYGLRLYPELMCVVKDKDKKLF